MKKKMVMMLMVVVMVGSIVIGCGSDTNENEDSKNYTIGITQFAEHGSLDNCREGFLEGLEESGIVEGENLTVDYKNAAADMGTAGQIAGAFVSDGVDLVVGIATPSAQTAYNAAMDNEIPVIYTAVTDPIAAELATLDGEAVGEVTGTSDKLAVEKQLEMIREMMPEAKKLGIMYTTSEVNSVSAIDEYEAVVEEYGFELITKGISSTADVSLATDDLLSEVDCMTNLTDNTVVNSLPTILEKAFEANIPVFGSEVEQVKIGCLAAQGLDYVELGKQTGEMAAKVLKGEAKASEIKFETIEEAELYFNSAVAEKLGLSISEDITSQASEIFDTIEEK